MATATLTPPQLTQVQAQPVYMVVAENSAIAFAVILYLNAENEQDVRELTMRWFLRTDHGIPTKYTAVSISDDIEEIVMSSNDKEICASLDIPYE